MSKLQTESFYHETTDFYEEPTDKLFVPPSEPKMPLVNLKKKLAQCSILCNNLSKKKTKTKICHKDVQSIIEDGLSHSKMQ